MTDSAGNEISKPDTSADGLSVSARFASYNEDINAVMIVALYDKDGGMYGIGMDSRFVSKDSSQTFSVDMSEFSIKNGTTMKVMFWDDFMNMTPLVDEKNF